MAEVQREPLEQRDLNEHERQPDADKEHGAASERGSARQLATRGKRQDQQNSNQTEQNQHAAAATPHTTPPTNTTPDHDTAATENSRSVVNTTTATTHATPSPARSAWRRRCTGASRKPSSTENHLLVMRFIVSLPRRGHGFAGAPAHCRSNTGGGEAAAQRGPAPHAPHDPRPSVGPTNLSER